MKIDDRPAKNTVFSRRTLLATAAAGAALVAAGRAGEVAQADDPISASRFEITIDGHSLGVFSDLHSLVSEIDASEFLTGTGVSAKKLPGKRKPPTLTLNHGLNDSLELWAWQEAVLSGDVSGLKNCDLVMYDATGRAIARYHLENAFPSKLEVGELTTGSTEVLMETVTLVCEHIQRVSP